MITGCSTSRQQADDLRYSFKNTFTVEAKESEYTRLRKALISPNYWYESDIAVAQRMFELTKERAKASPYGIGERLDRAVEEALIIGISAGFIHAGGRVINEINAGALTAKPTTGAIQNTNNLNISNNVAKHIDNLHNPNTYANQLLYKPQASALTEIQSKTFFNSSWSSSQIQDAVNYGYNQAVANGLTNNPYTFTYDGETVTIAFENGVPQSAWGSFKYTYEQLLNLIK